MHVIRRARLEDVGTLMKLAKMVHFINLPPDKEMISDKIVASRESFRRAAAGTGKPAGRAAARPRESGVRGYGDALGESDIFMFVLEDSDSGAVLGTSQLIAKMGGPGNPNYGFKLERRHFFADDIKTGTSHTVARLQIGRAHV